MAVEVFKAVPVVEAGPVRFGRAVARAALVEAAVVIGRGSQPMQSNGSFAPAGALHHHGNAVIFCRRATFVDDFNGWRQVVLARQPAVTVEREGLRRLDDGSLLGWSDLRTVETSVESAWFETDDGLRLVLLVDEIGRIRGGPKTTIVNAYRDDDDVMAGLSAWYRTIAAVPRPCARAVRMKSADNTSIMLAHVSLAI